MPFRIEDLEEQVGIEEFAACEPTPAQIAAIESVSHTCSPDYASKIRRLGDRLRDMLATPAPHDQLSEQRMAIICALVKRRFTDGEIWSTLEASPWLAELARRKGEKHAPHLIATEIAKARLLVTPFPEEPTNGSAPIDVSGLRNGNGAHRNDRKPEDDPEVGQEETQSQEEPSRTLSRFPRTDAGSAEMFAALYGDRVRFDHLRGTWLIYGAHWWQPDRDGEVLRLAKETARRRYIAAMNIADQNDREAEARFAIASENRAKIDAMLALARAEHPITDDGEGWDSDAYALGVENGVVELRIGKLRPGVPEDRISRHAPVRFVADAQAPQFERFLTEILPDDDVREYVHRLAGMALTGDVREQILPFLHGGGANGKSTLANVIRETLGRPYARQAAPGLLLRSNTERHPTQLADLFGARLVLSVEVDDGRALAESLVKWLTGGDQVKARFMKQDFFEFTPTFKIWLLANHRPAIRGTDHAIWRRVKLIPFEITITEPDERLPEKLRAEASGILNWMIAGCLAWQRDGLQEPEAVRAAVDEYRTDADVLAPFLEACCIVAHYANVGAQQLYKAYRSWAQDAGLSDREMLGSRRFGERMSERFDRRSLEGGRRYFGVGIRVGGGE